LVALALIFLLSVDRWKKFLHRRLDPSSNA
jgi:hypothetical protein